MPVEPGAVDANVLVYAMDVDATQHAASRALVEAARNPAITLLVISQILCEFYSIVTNPRRVTVARTPEEALDVIGVFLALPGMRVLPMPAGTVSRWMDLVRRHPVKGGEVFDLQLVATLQANNIDRIYTFNKGDFEAFPELHVLTP
jgi:predicted nucleic acid-binding protein